LSFACGPPEPRFAPKDVLNELSPALAERVDSTSTVGNEEAVQLDLAVAVGVQLWRHAESQCLGVTGIECERERCKDAVQHFSVGVCPVCPRDRLDLNQPPPPISDRDGQDRRREVSRDRVTIELALVP